MQSVPRIKAPDGAKEYRLHPEGRFKAKLVECEDIRRARSGTTFYMPVFFETEHGRVYSAFNGTPDTLMLISKSWVYYKEYSEFVIDVKHEPLNGNLFASVRVNWEHTNV